MAQKRAEDTSGLCVPSVSEARVATGLWNPVEELEAAAGSSSRWEVDKDFLCPICIQMMKDAFLTPCGHSFCYSCIKTHLHNKNNCPSCAHYLTVNQIIPNFLLNKLLKKASMCQVVSKSSLTDQLRVALQQGAEVSVKELDSLLSLLVEKKRKVEQEEAETNMEILLDFLNRLRQQKQHELNEVQEDLQFIKEDIGMVEKQRQELVVAKEQFCLRLGLHTDGQDATLGTTVKSDVECFLSGREHSGASVGMAREENHIRPSSAMNKGGGLSGNISESGNLMLSTGSSMARKKRILEQGLFRGKAEFYDGLQECYLQKRRPTTGSHVERHLDMCEEIEGNGEMSNQVAGLERFKNVLNAFTRYSRLRLVSEVRLGDLFHSSNIVSSIEFDRDDEMFATAGVSKRIKIFEFTTIVNELDDMHCPVAEMSARWKLSCLSWNKYTKGQIASSDYEGTVTVWDIETRQSIMEYEEHEKRAWSVDFSRTEPSRLVSGSDDGKVKIWCTKQEASALTIDMKANVCSVKYNPASSNFVAVGSADHHIHYYDIRHVAAPLHVFSGHRKAVSYVKFLSSNELASASTDSTLRLWDVKNNSLVRTLEGHTNEKNFVGLTVNGDFLACGSETNEVYVYHKEISKPAISNRFGSDPDDDTSHFISAVCWKSDSPTLLAANSQGTIRVLVLAS